MVIPAMFSIMSGRIVHSEFVLIEYPNRIRNSAVTAVRMFRFLFVMSVSGSRKYASMMVSVNPKNSEKKLAIAKPPAKETKTAISARFVAKNKPIKTAEATIRSSPILNRLSFIHALFTLLSHTVKRIDADDV